MTYCRKAKGKKVVWTCEECTPKDTELGPVPSRKSKRICQAAEVRLSTKQMRKHISFSTHKTHVHVESSAETKQSNGDFLFSVDKSKTLPFSDETVVNHELRKKKRRLIIEDGDCLDEESEQIKADASQLVPPTVCDCPLKTTCNVQPLESSNYVHSQPIINPIWTMFQYQQCQGPNFCRTSGSRNKQSLHRSAACGNCLPLLVTVEILSKSYVWPRRFQILPPTEASAALFFFPEYESDERVFDSILDDMIDHNLALKAVLKDLELLVFSSRELPPDHWRVCRKYYL